MVALALLLVGVGWPDAAPAETGRRPSGVPVVTDATGQVVGPLVGYQGPAALAVLDIGGPIVVLHVAADRFLGAGHAVYFESADCSGPVLLSAGFSVGHDPLFPRSGIGPGQVLHVETGAAPVSRPVQSLWDQTLTPPDCDPFGFSFDADVVPTSQGPDLGQYVGPFEVR
jgi:hypothetical protein